MKTSLLCLGFALAATGCTPAADDTTAQKEIAMKSLLDQPVGKYAVIPHVVKNDDKDTYTGRFDLLVKKNDFTTAEAFDVQGRQGTAFCANFDVYQTQLQHDGKMGLPYKQWRPGARFGHFEYVYQSLNNMNPETLLGPKGSIILDKDGTYDLEVEVKQACRFTPKTP